MGVADEYSTVCEECGQFNFKPIKCKECWMKEVHKKGCRHKWFIGAGIGGLVKLKNGKTKIVKKGLYILCDKCRKTIRAYDRKYL